MVTILERYDRQVLEIDSALIIAYERKDLLVPLMDHLAQLKIAKVYIAIDGPRSNSQFAPQIEIESLAKECGSVLGLEVEVWRRDQNYGLALSVISAIDWFFSNEKIGLILEDDIMVSGSFLNFANQVLREYDTDPNVLMAAATRPDSFENDGIVKWTHYPMIWGWATTSIKWSICKGMIIHPKPVFGRVSDGRVAFYWSLALRRISTGRLDSWAVPLASQMKSGDFLCAIPPVNFATNIGFGEHATHTKKISSGMNAARGEWEGKFEFAGYVDIETDAKEGDVRIERNNYKISRFIKLSYLMSFALDPLRLKRKNKLSLESRLSEIALPKNSD
jgi:hypothetical protein